MKALSQPTKHIRYGYGINVFATNHHGQGSTVRVIPVKDGNTSDCEMCCKAAAKNIVGFKTSLGCESFYFEFATPSDIDVAKSFVRVALADFERRLFYDDQVNEKEKIEFANSYISNTKFASK